MKRIKTLTVGGETYRITDPEAARIDDTAVQEETAWSGKHTVDMLAPAFLESGSIVACQPVAGYPLTVQAQEGATVTRCGKNLWDLKSGVTQVTTAPKSSKSRMVCTCGKMSLPFGACLSCGITSSTLSPFFAM